VCETGTFSLAGPTSPHPTDFAGVYIADFHSANREQAASEGLKSEYANDVYRLPAEVGCISMQPRETSWKAELAVRPDAPSSRLVLKAANQFHLDSSIPPITNYVYEHTMDAADDGDGFFIRRIPAPPSPPSPPPRPGSFPFATLTFRFIFKDRNSNELKVPPT
jgi:hypothetical protein